jgi:hypothetical protein
MSDACLTGAGGMGSGRDMIVTNWQEHFIDNKEDIFMLELTTALKTCM